MEHTSSFKKCIICQTNPQELRCLKCDLAYCQECETKIHTNILQKLHSDFIEKVDKKELTTGYCPTHKKRYKSFCKIHKALVCEDCESDFCWKHKKEISTIKTIHTELTKQVGNVQIKLLSLKHQIINDQISLTQKKDLMEKDFNRLEKYLTQKCEQMKEQIDEFGKKSKRILSLSKVVTEKRFEDSLEFKSKLLIDLKSQKSTIKKIEGLREKENKETEQVIYSLQVIENFKATNERFTINKQNELMEKEKLGPNEADKIFQSSKDTFDGNWKDSEIKLLQEDKMAIKIGGYLENKGGIIFGKNIISEGLHHIKIKINNFPQNSKPNWIKIGVIASKNKKRLPWKKEDFNKLFYFSTFYSSYKKELTSQKLTINPNVQREAYGKPFKTGDILHIFLDMNKKEISFGVNDDKFGVAFDNLPESVNLWYFLKSQQEDFNKISLLF
ncbi:hypothetical protein M0812_11045 [Anaeramoeba flamelloides]|uniref:B30.2/SPRY domain-containing protein n=1 Tax=Anaeramoeba flamelloides TaxID=1746091 RepID=A0AAV7ZZ13_9EUKA|nr:hypothetical protein M0812_11045 [Anaeramoeba flamelloides]